MTRVREGEGEREREREREEGAGSEGAFHDIGQTLTQTNQNKPKQTKRAQGVGHLGSAALLRLAKLLFE
jgi:hypothetical protein